MAPSLNCESDTTENNNVDSQSVEVATNIEKMGGKMLIHKLAGEGVVKVVKQCENAKETLGPCDFSYYVIRKIPPQLSTKFKVITDLNLSKNEIYKILEEFVDMKELVRLDISHNYLQNLPPVLFRIPKLRQLRATDNAIIDIESDQVIASESLELVDLRSNRLTPQCYKMLKNAQVNFHIELSTRRIKEDWEDLTI